MACGQRAVLAALLLLAAVLVEPSAGGGANTSLLDALAAFPGLAEPPAAHAWVVDAIHVDAGPLARAPGDGPVLGNATAAFVRVDGKRFMLGCKQFMPVGWNSYTMLEQAAQARAPPVLAAAAAWNASLLAGSCLSPLSLATHPSILLCPCSCRWARMVPTTRAPGARRWCPCWTPRTPPD